LARQETSARVSPYLTTVTSLLPGAMTYQKRNEEIHMNLLQIIREKMQKEELDEEEMRDLVDYLDALKEELRRLRILLYNGHLGYIGDFEVVFKEPWYFSQVYLKCLDIGECGFVYLDSFIWRIVTGGIEVRPFITTMD